MCISNIKQRHRTEYNYEAWKKPNSHNGQKEYAQFSLVYSLLQFVCCDNELLTRNGNGLVGGSSGLFVS